MNIFESGVVGLYLPFLNTNIEVFNDELRHCRKCNDNSKRKRQNFEILREV